MNMSKLRIEYEDEHLLVIYKPAGLLSQKSKPNDICIADLLEHKLDYVGLLHRLDRPVSGPVMIAKTKRAATLFSRLIKNRKIYKKYKAIVFGKPEVDSCKLRHFLRSVDGKVASIGKEETKEFKFSELDYKISSFDKTFSLLSINLITGRKHQIRAQLSAIGHPIVGDSKYYNIEGAGRTKFSEDVISKMNDSNFLPWGEIALTCDYLSFKHPLDHGKLVEIKIDYPSHWIKIQ